MRSLAPFLFFLCGMISPSLAQQTGEMLPNDARISEANADSLLLPVNSETFFGSPHMLMATEYNHRQTGIPLNRNSSHDWKLFIILIGLSAIAAARYLFGSRVGNYYRAAFGSVFFSQMEREGGFFNETVTYLLYLNFLIIFSLLAWQSVMYFDLLPPNAPAGGLAIFLIMMLAIILFYLAKSSLMGFLSWTFNTRQASSAYLKNIFLFNQLIGLVLLPVIIYITYSPSGTMIFVAWAIWMVISLARLFRGAMIGLGNISFPAYYLILYLCMIELVPFLLIIKIGTIFLAQA